ncbi:fimbria/pilus outer membrane usher protein [Enterobacter soli]|uniref:fimbria/pilus outer membrane usher protein n=1 Tax=Enterobacter soli TaxID=885040 RepID=UPI00308308F3
MKTTSPARLIYTRSLLALLLWLAIVHSARAEPLAEQTQWLAITLNHAERDGLWACRVAGDALWIARSDIKKLGLRAPADNHEWIELSALPGVQVSVDALAQQATILASASALDNQQHLVSKAPEHVSGYPLAEPISALTLAYSLYASETETSRQASTQTTLTASGVVPGILRSSFSSRTGDESSSAHTRLMTQWQWDNPASLTSLTLGDSITTGTSWSRQVHFGGLHFARNFQLNPQLNTAPRAQYSDSVVLPSTVDLYIDGLKQSSQNVAPGDYLLDTLPTFTGSGQAQVVVTDINGQRRTVLLDLYGAPGMLAEGLSSGALDLGWARQNYAVRSDDYAASPMLDSGWRYGVNNHLTLALHTEQQRRMHHAGIGSDWLISPRAGIVSQHIAYSDSQYGQGIKWGAGWQWNGNGTGISASTVRSEKNFADNARMSGTLPARRSDTLWVSHSFRHAGTLGAGWVQQNLQGSEQRYLNASWSATLPLQISATLSYTRSLSDASHTVQLMMTIPFGSHDTLSVQASRNTPRLDYRHQPNEQTGGWSWQAGQSFGENGEKYADVGNLSRYGEWHIGMERGDHTRSQYATGEGSLTLLDSTLHALRYNEQGLALISTHGIGHVPVLLENRPAGETDDEGYLLLTDLPRYHNSKVTIDPLSLPADVMTPVTDIYARSGTATAVKVDFDVHHAVSVQARLVNSRHQPLPMGSVVSTPRGATIVGRDGFIWLEDPPLPGELVVTTAQGTCRVALPPTQSSTSRLNLGEQPCR